MTERTRKIEIYKEIRDDYLFGIVATDIALLRARDLSTFFRVPRRRVVLLFGPRSTLTMTRGNRRLN